MSPALYAGAEAIAWHAFPWTAFGRSWRERGGLAIAPIYAIANRGEGLPLDAEEAAGAAFLDRALFRLGPEFPCLVLPPLRHAPRLSSAIQFGLDPEAAHAVLEELARSVRQAGFGRLVLCQANSALEGWIEMTARDLRVALGMQTFCLHLARLGLALDPGTAAARLAEGDFETLSAEPLASAVERLASALREMAARLPLTELSPMPQPKEGGA